MSIKINSEYCIACGWCQPRCKNEAINEVDGVYIIDPNRCTECVGWYKEPRCIENCSMGAPEPDPLHQESQEQLLAKWKKLHPHLTPQIV